MKRKVLIIGDSYMNLQMSVPGAVQTFGKTLGNMYSLYPSGDAAISAISASKNGADCVFLTKLGDDFYGERIFDFFRTCELSTSNIKLTKEYQTGVEFTAFDGIHKTSYVAKGANATLTKSDIDDAFSTMPDLFLIPHDYLVFNQNLDTPQNQSNFTDSRIDLQIGNVNSYNQVNQVQTSRPENIAVYAINKALSLGIDMCVEYTDTTALLPLDKIEKGLKIVVIKDEMIKKITGTTPSTIEKTLSALISFSSKVKSKYYIIQKGNDTSFIYDGTHFEIAQLPPIINTLSHQNNKSMRDSYIGAMIAEYNNTHDILKACKYAQCVSALTTANVGSIDYIPSRRTVTRFLKEKCGMNVEDL
ncbi:MAG: PfkB family carbohydrate kinase [Clostridia bacterium]|nr:PfkB family carbohydrate kinase [Clostridia bacterium]